MRKPQLGSHAVSGVFIFLLVGLFAVSALLLTLIGTQVYRRVTDAGAQSVRMQTLMSYLNNKVHAYDRAGGVAVETRGGQPVLALREELDGESYTTLIYAQNGTVCEQLLWEGDELDAELGQPIAQASDLSFELDGALLTLRVAAETGESVTARVALRAAPEGGE